VPSFLLVALIEQRGVITEQGLVLAVCGANIAIGSRSSRLPYGSAAVGVADFAAFDAPCGD
jgi:hypothetical protein